MLRSVRWYLASGREFDVLFQERKRRGGGYRWEERGRMASVEHLRLICSWVVRGSSAIDTRGIEVFRR